MKKRMHKFEKDMRMIIRNVYENKKLPDLESEQFKEALWECCEQGYLSGVSAARMSAGNLCFDLDENICATYKGLTFLEDKHPDRRANIGLIVSIITAAVTFAAQSDRIYELAQKIIEIFKH